MMQMNQKPRVKCIKSIGWKAHSRTDRSLLVKKREQIDTILDDRKLRELIKSNGSAGTGLAGSSERARGLEGIW